MEERYGKDWGKKMIIPAQKKQAETPPEIKKEWVKKGGYWRRKQLKKLKYKDEQIITGGL